MIHFLFFRCASMNLITKWSTISYCWTSPCIYFYSIALPAVWKSICLSVKHGNPFIFQCHFWALWALMVYLLFLFWPFSILGLVLKHSVEIRVFYWHSHFPWNQFWQIQSIKNGHFDHFGGHDFFLLGHFCYFHGLKFFIICKPEMSTLNSRNELTSCCRHARKFLLKNVII